MPWGDHDKDKMIDFDIHVSLVIVSDSLFSGEKSYGEDQSGMLAVDLLSQAGINSISVEYFPDDFAALKAKMEGEVRAEMDVILLTGGTGIAPKDVTTEACRAIIHKEIPGFGEEFRRRSFEQIQERGLISRTLAGIVRKTLVVSLPGSPNGVRTGVEILVPMIPHVINLLRGG